jgi:hypothetical protein
MTLAQLYLWHRQEAERFTDLSKSHQTNGSTTHRNAVTRRYEKQAEFHSHAATLLKLLATA